MTSMQDVADRAKVSVSTVSHVINETRFVSEEKRTRVFAAMKALNYHPNLLASSLRRKDKSTKTVGLLIPDSSNPFFAEILRGAEDAAFQAGYNIFLCNSDNSPEKEIQYINALASKQIDGIILVSSGTTASLDQLSQKEIPTVVVDRELGETTDSVTVENALGGEIATEYLLGLGHQRIGCIMGRSTITPSAKRAQGYRQALQSARLPIDEQLTCQGSFDPQSGYQCARKLLALPDPPTAIFVCNDMMAIGAIRAANDLNYRVPDELSIIGFDNISLASYTTPPLTTIAQPSYEMGFLAAEFLSQRLEDATLPSQQKIFMPFLVERDSCKKITAR